MTMPSKVLWGEGLFLRPQHFQQQDHYHEHRLHQSAMALQPYLWGLRTLAVDTEALANGTLRVLALALMFQDGELYEAPQHDDLPPPIDLGNLPPAQQSVTYYAALPSLLPFGGNFAPVDKPDKAARFGSKNHDTPDLYTHAAQAEVTVLNKALRMLADSEARDAYVCLPVLRLRRRSTGGFELDTSYVPPCLSIDSAPQLVTQLRYLLEALQAKVNALYGHHREPSKNIIEYRSGDMSSFWLLHTASAGFASLSHYQHHPRLHPERLYEQLLGLAGALMTFSKNHTLADLDPYQHADPGPRFAKLYAIIRELLDTVISSKFFAIVLEQVRPSYFRGRLDSGKIDAKTVFYLAVSANIAAIDLVEAVPLGFKIGAPDDVDKFVQSAMPGVVLKHTPQVPAAVPVRPDTYYFALEARGPLYERMLQSQSISIYVPSGLPDLKLDLVAVTA